VFLVVRVLLWAKKSCIAVGNVCFGVSDECRIAASIVSWFGKLSGGCRKQIRRGTRLIAAAALGSLRTNKLSPRLWREHFTYPLVLV